jgi:hypothetical protein
MTAGGKDMELQLSEAQAQLRSRVDALWKLSVTRDVALVRDALHPSYAGWVTGQPGPHDREAAIAAVGPSSPRVLSYRLTPLGITVFDGVVGVVHYRYAAEVDAGTGSASVNGRRTESYLRKNGEWLMISVSGGPDGQR